MHSDDKKAIKYTLVGLVVVVIIIGALDYTGLMWKSFIGPKRQNVDTQIFYEGQAWTESNNRELAKYYDEYMHAEPGSSEREVITQLIKVNFSDVRAEKIKTPTLQAFLIQQRGF